MSLKEPDRFVNALIDELKKRREELGLSHEKISIAAGIDRSTVGRMESGKRLPSIRYLYGLAKALEIPLSEIVKRAEDKME